MRQLWLVIVLGLGACGGGDPCKQLETKLCEGMDEKTCKSAMESLGKLESAKCEEMASNDKAIAAWRKMQRRATEMRERAGEAEAQAEKAQQEAEAAQVAAKTAQENVQKLVEKTEQIDKELTAVMATLADAKTEADRNVATAKLAELQKAKAEQAAKLAEAKAEAMKAERKRGSKVSVECQNNPLAKGCM